MKVLVTGSKGFIGKNLIARLLEEKNIEVVEYDKEDSFEIIDENLESIDFIFHLAGINRPENPKEFYEGNTDLTRELITRLKRKNLKIPILITSSIQSLLDNDYGKSKKAAEEIILEYGNSGSTFIYRLHNVFGKWCRPNYNSAVATFCYNIAHDEEIIISNPNSIVQLVYIDDVIEEFLYVMKNGEARFPEEGFAYVKPVYKKTLKEITDLIYSFKVNMANISVPETGNDFVKKLFSTYLSYVPLDDLVATPIMHTDDRGSFTELIRTENAGQVSISVSKPGIFRGNHYHHTKMERFIVVQGKAKITFRHILTNESKEFHVDDTQFKIVNIPVGYTHKIENIGSGDMILLLWCNEIFEPDKPDTYWQEV